MDLHPFDIVNKPQQITLYTGTAGMEAFQETIEYEARLRLFKRLYVKRKMRIVKRKLYKPRYTNRYYFLIKK